MLIKKVLKQIQIDVVVGGGYKTKEKLYKMAEADQKMDMLSGRFFAVAEGYPELRSSEVFVELQKGIRDAEEHLQAARRLYNASVADYNTAISVFPAKLLAGARRPREFFAAETEKQEDVKITF